MVYLDGIIQEMMVAVQTPMSTFSLPGGRHPLEKVTTMSIRSPKYVLNYNYNYRRHCQECGGKTATPDTVLVRLQFFIVSIQDLLHNSSTVYSNERVSTGQFECQS